MSARRLTIRLLKWAAVGLAGVLLLIIALLGFALATTPGAQIVVGQLTDTFVPAIDIERVRGPLRGPLILEGVVYETAAARVELDSLYLEWRLRDLLDGRARIRRLFVSGADVSLKPSEADSKETRTAEPQAGPPSLGLPISVSVGQATVVGLRLETAEGYSLTRGQLGLSGRPEEYEIDLEGRLSAPRIGPSHLRLAGRGDLRGLRIEDARAQVLGGRAKVNGSIHWWPTMGWSLAVEVDSAAPGPVLPEPSRWPGSLSLRAQSEGRLTAAGPEIELRADTLFGTLRDRPIAGRGSFRIDPQSLSASDLGMSWGSARLRASGSSVAGRVDLEFAARIPELNLFVPAAAGYVEIDGRLSGSRTAPRIDARFYGHELSYSDSRVDSLMGSIAVNLEREEVDSLRLSVVRLVTAGRSIRSLRFEGAGSRTEHEIDLSLASDYGSLAMALAGGLSDTAWSGAVRALTIANDSFGRWQLREPPVPLRAAPMAIVLDERLCLSSGDSRACLGGSWRSVGPWRANVDLQGLPLAMAEPWFPPGWSIDGKIQGSVRLATDSAGAISIRADLEPGPGTIRLPVGPRRLALRYEAASIEALTEERGSRGILRMALAEADGARVGQLEARVELPGVSALGWPLQDESLEGRLALRLDNLAPVDALIPRVRGLSGTFALDVAVDQTIQNPRVVGEARWRDGQVRVPEFGLQLEGITMTATGDTTGRIFMEGALRSGEGGLEMRGESPLRPKEGDPFKLELTGDRVLAVNTPRTQLLASPELEISFDNRRVDVMGEVEIPEADIRVREAEGARVAVSEDVVYVDSIGMAKDGLVVTARVRVVLGEQVSVAGRGFEGKIDGELTVVEQEESPTQASGEIVIEDGSYGAFGQELQIEEGRLIFAGGPIDNPGLDIRATRTAEDSVVVGVLVHGTARSPVITLFSNPPLPDQEILARLATGGGLAGASPGNGSALETVQAKLGLRGANLLLNRITSGLGLAEARIKSEGGLDEASVLVGKYLSPKVYVAYGASLFEPLRTVQIRYLLSSRWTLVAETGVATGADILYEIGE